MRNSSSFSLILAGAKQENGLFMNTLTIIIAVLVGIGIVFFIIYIWYAKQRRRREITAQPFPPEWKKYVEKYLPAYDWMPPELKKQLHDRIMIFLDEKDFEGCGGLEVTDEMRVAIAAQACILLLNRKTGYFPQLRTILIYPHAYVAKGGTRSGNTFIHDETVRLGESWLHGAVVLTWDNIKHGAMDIHDGHNVVFHEFAHQLDQESGAADGVPILGQQRSVYITWARILGEEFVNLQDEVKRGIRDVMDEYGATNPAEFFAVATETFFEKANQMHHRHPELYEAMKNYYQVDPLDWKHSVNHQEQ